MPSAAVADTSTLAALSAIGQTRLLMSIFGTIFIPAAVFRELITDGEGWRQAEEVQRVIREESWIRQPEVPWPGAIAAGGGLGGGEREAIGLALHLNLPLLTNDQKARRRAETLGVEVRGSLGILEAAKQLGLISEVKPLAFAMRDAGIHLSDDIITQFLKRIGEAP
jgi:predicted nucleic acid-binding protein